MIRICQAIALSALATLAACTGPAADVKQLAASSAPVAAATSQPALNSGVSHDLAKWRAAHVSNVEYDLSFAIPEGQDEAIRATAKVRFDLTQAGAEAAHLPLDFRETADKLRRLGINGQPAVIDHRLEHLLLPGTSLHAGANEVEIEFIAGDTSLNRNPDFLYTLFVPDRARTAFPVFDQPDLKSRYRLTIDAPSDWLVLTNAPLESTHDLAGKTRHQFAQSQPIASYVFSFVAGKFESETRVVDGREMTLLHRETDAEKYARSVDAIFQQHADALAWMEAYSGIPYPYEKFDFVAIPAFQYGGMEHPGAIQYRASALFLDEDPAQPQLLRRASLIAHETAHMWFGDDVTMRWFDDVWTKEVFANFFAAKMVNPGFPEVNHDLNFLLDHFPSAYGVDRTQGANPIRQPLANLNQAGSLYGPIIYDKAPIMMQQLELLLGAEAFQAGMREYLATYAGSNATWPDLIAILDKRTGRDLAAWSKVWVNSPGRPHYMLSDAGTLEQTDPLGEGREWPQEFGVLAAADGGPGGALYNADGRGYGLFPVDIEVVADRWDDLTDLQKGAQIINLYEQMLERHPQLAPARYYSFLEERALAQSDQLLLAEMLGQISDIHWRLLPEQARVQRAARLERAMFGMIDRPDISASTRKLVLEALQDVALTPAALARLQAIWASEESVPGIALSQRELTDLAAMLAIKQPAQAQQIIETQAAGITNPDEQRRFAFLTPALSADPNVRDAFFASLGNADNRATENWVLSALGYLHHPLRTSQSQAYVGRSLAWLDDIQRTGDIFFPAGWISANLRNHIDPAVAATVRDFLAGRPDYNPQLRLKILQAADPVFRAVDLSDVEELP